MSKVPMPVPDFGGDKEALARRDYLILEYGEDTVKWAEVSVLIGMFFSLGVIRPREFGDLVETQCKKTDDRRRRAAGFTD